MEACNDGKHIYNHVNIGIVARMLLSAAEADRYYIT